MPSGGTGLFHSYRYDLWYAGLMARKMKLRGTLNTTTDEFERQMAIALEIMKKDWVALRALALGDQYPDLDVEKSLARKRAAARGKMPKD